MSITSSPALQFLYGGSSLLHIDRSCDASENQCIGSICTTAEQHVFGDYVPTSHDSNANESVVEMLVGYEQSNSVQYVFGVGLGQHIEQETAALQYIFDGHLGDRQQVDIDWVDHRRDLPASRKRAARDTAYRQRVQADLGRAAAARAVNAQREARRRKKQSGSRTIVAQDAPVDAAAHDRPQRKRRRVDPQPAAVGQIDVGGACFEAAFKLLTVSHSDASTFTAQKTGVLGDLSVAADMQQHFHNHLPVHVCAVCAVYRGLSDISTVHNLESCSLHLLRCDGPCSSKMPRPALTRVDIHGVEYCLAPEGVVRHRDGTVALKVCHKCFGSLRRKVVPRISLCYFDAGRKQSHLPALTVVEELIVAVLRVNRYTVVARPPGSHRGRTRDTFNLYLQGHVIALPNPPLTACQTLLSPLDPDSLAEYVKVVILAHAQDRQHAEQLASRVQCVMIRPAVIAAWVEWLLPIYRRRFSHMHFDVDTAALRKYSSMADLQVPVSLRKSAMFVESEEEAAAAVEQYAGVRSGYANARPSHVGGEQTTADGVDNAPNAHVDDAAFIQTLALDYGVLSSMVTDQLTVTVLNRVLRLYPCSLAIPERIDDANPGVVLLAATRNVQDMTEFLSCVQQVSQQSATSLYHQLDQHIKHVVRMHQLSAGHNGCMDGIEEFEVVVDTTAALNASLPGAFQQLMEDQDDARNVLTGRDPHGVLAVCSADSHPFSDFDKSWVVLTHPNAFPNGEGGPPEGMSLEFWMQVHLQRAPRELCAEQPTLVLDLFNIKQRHAVINAARIQVQAAPHMFAELASMPADEIKQAVDLFMAKQKGRSYAERLAEAPPRVGKLLKALRQIGSKVEGTPAYFASVRSRSFALWHAFGPFTTFPTFNPSELQSPSCMKLLGFDIEYESTDFGAPMHMPPMVDRWRAVARNPVACAQYFNTYRNAIWSVLLGWDRKDNAQQHPDCRFGRILAGCDRIECSGRGALHGHFLLSQADLQPGRLEQLQQVALQQLDGFLQQISAKHVPDGWFIEGSADWVETDSANSAVDFKGIDNNASLGVSYQFPVIRHLLDYCSGDERLKAQVEASVKQYQARIASAVLLHAHSSRCQKGGRAGDDSDCAMYKPEQVQEHTEVLEGGCMLLRCDHGMLVPHVPALLLFEPCNHMVSVCADASRYMTEKMRAEAAGVEFTAKLPSLLLHAAMAANYAAKYLFKRPQDADATLQYLNAAINCRPVSDMEAANMSTADLAVKGKRMMTRLINMIDGRLVVPQALAANYCCQFGDHHMTHATIAYYPTSFVLQLRNELAQHLVGVSEEHRKTMAQPVYTGDSVVYVNSAVDYKYRHPKLSELPAYFYLMLCEKVGKRCPVAVGRDEAADDGADAVPDLLPRGFLGENEFDGSSACCEEREFEFHYSVNGTDHHPQCDSHKVIMRKSPHLPQAVTNFQVQPPADAPLHERELYALTVLSMFMSDRLLRRLRQWEVPLMQILEAWEADLNFDYVFCATPWGPYNTPIQDCLLWLLQAEYTLKEALTAIVDKGDCDRVYSRWHKLGSSVVANMQSLAIAQKEDNERSVYMRREKLRRAKHCCGHADDGSDLDVSEAESDDVDFYSWEEVEGSTPLGLAQLPGDPADVLRAILTPPDLNASYQPGLPNRQYHRHALSTLPPVDFGAKHTQSPAVTSCHTSNTIEDSTVVRCLESASEAHTAFAANAQADFVAQGTPYRLQGVGDVRVQHMDLMYADTPVVAARIQYITPHSNEAQTVVLNTAEHGPPPCRKMPVAPSIKDTITLFTLSNEQAFSFAMLADALLHDLQGQSVPPIRMVLTGEPGTGKSQVLKAFEWFCLQYDASNRLLVASYTWRSALMVANAQHPARSTCNAFALSMKGGASGDCSDTVGPPVRFVFLDEYSFISGKHLFDINKSVQRGRGSHDYFAGLHVILCGDVCQHQPVKGLPLYASNDVRRQHNAQQRRAVDRLQILKVPVSVQAGLNIYKLMFDTVVFLQQQQRIRSVQDVLFANTRLFIRAERASWQEVADFCDQLNSKVVPDLCSLAHQVPRVVCLRNEVRAAYNLSLLCLHAKHLGVRPVAWRTRDLLTKKSKLNEPLAGRIVPPREALDALALLRAEDTGKVAGVQFYFPGCRYVFINNQAPVLGYVNNGECIGRGILLSPGEEDPGDGPIWWLNKPPLAVFVEPQDANVSQHAWEELRSTFPTIPQNCVPAVSKCTAAFTVVLPKPLVLKYKNKDVEVSELSIRRYGVQLGEGYAVTDFYTQGMNFKKDCWLAHLCPPPDGGGLKRAAVFVVLTRWGEWDDVKLIVPLWPEGDHLARKRVIEAFHRAACLEPELKAEIARLKQTAVVAKGKHAEHWRIACEAVDSRIAATACG